MHSDEVTRPSFVGVADIEPGTSFDDRFRVEQILGLGGMGSVYVATDVQSGERVALKVLRRERSPDPEARERFRREAEILASFQHPGIVKIRGFGHATDGTPWMAMELLEGETLLDRVRRKGPLAPWELIPILRATCEGLSAAHARGVVHRDLKPENIFLPEGNEGHAKILDFGLSSLVGSTKLTRTGALIGTPRYMAPEQIRSARESDARVDIYALGVIVFEALAGHSPFTASDQGQLLGAILTGRTERLTEARPDLAPALDAVLARAMATSPDERYSRASELADAFADAVAQIEEAAPPPLVRPRFSTHALGVVAPIPPVAARRSFLFRSVAIAVVLAVVIGVLWVALRT